MKTLRLGILGLAATMAGTALVAVVAGSAQAADMPLKARPALVPVYTWTGFYGGINGGYAWSGDRSVTFTPGDPLIQAVTCGPPVGNGTCALPASPKLQGGFGGLQAGYNWQVNPYVLAGLEADFQGSAIRGSATNPTFNLFGTNAQIATEHSVTWFGTVRGRLGFLPTDRLLIYGTGGLAYGRVEANSVLTPSTPFGGGIGLGFGFNCFAGVGFPNCFTGNSAHTATGWTAGGGFEFALSANASLKAEYLYVSLGANDHTLVAVSSGIVGLPRASFIVGGKVDYSLARVGLNYRFDPPVVAKY
jgi:outer membrane immunogenic protein